MQETDWLEKPYYSLNAYFKHTYGQKIYKISVNAGLSCPNRDGSLDNRGCIFCSEGGSGDFAVDISDGVYHKEYAGREAKNRRVLAVSRQIERGIARFNKKVGEKFVIYFQAYTNTYGDVDYLREIWTAALDNEQVVGISIATRPDCLSSEVMELLTELKDKYCGDVSVTDSAFRKFIWVELGLQTIHEKTADYIRRHYPLSVYDQGVKKLSLAGIPYITHIILGLPGETREMMLQTVEYVNGSIYRPQGIKLQLLHVLRQTDLAEHYEKGEFSVLEMEEYIDLVIDCLRRISPEVVIHRVTGDGPKSILIAPLWSGNKKLVLNTLHRRMRELGARQGDLPTENNFPA